MREGGQETKYGRGERGSERGGSGDRRWKRGDGTRGESGRPGDRSGEMRGRQETRWERETGEANERGRTGDWR